MRIAICGGNTENRNQLEYMVKEFIEKNDYIAEIITISEKKLMLQSMKQEKYDIIFLDMQMESNQGMRIAKQIRQINNTCCIICISENADDAVESYDIDATYYLLRPIKKDKLECALNKCGGFLKEARKKIELISNREKTIIFRRDINYAEIYKDKTTIVTNKKNYITYMTLNELFEKLGGYPYIRCHRSFIVNLATVTKVEKGSQNFLLYDGTTVPIGRSYNRSARSQFHKFVMENVREHKID